MRGYLRGMVWGGVTGVAALSLASVASDLPRLMASKPEAVAALPSASAKELAKDPKPPRVYGDGSGTLPSLVPAPATDPTQEVAALTEAPADVSPNLPPADLPQIEDVPQVEPPPLVALPDAALPEAAPQIAPDLPQPKVEPAAPEPSPPEPAPAEIAVEPPTTRPTPGFTREVEGVRTGQLPSIGAAAPSQEAAEDQPQGGALQRNARAFENPQAKPPFAILLLDDPQSDMDLTEIAKTDLPLTLVIDAATPKSIERAALWRAAGQEVALLATALPKSNTPSDLEVALEALALSFPEALALVDPVGGLLQGDRQMATALAPALAARGYGLVTWEQGMKTADQVARREGVPAATIYRLLDDKDEAAPVIRRYLDRAAFKAQQDGQAMVVGSLRPQTLQAVTEWAREGRAASLALAPLSAVVSRP